jgi:hypothetical protein
MEARETDRLESVRGKGACEKIPDVIRKESKAGHLSLRDGILDELAKQNILDPQQQETSELLDILLRKTLEENEDLRKVSDPGGASRYYSSRFMTDSFANLLLQKEGDPLLLLAETVRENSRIYPRPIPLDAFKDPPFHLTEKEILACLQQMAETDAYQDIQRTATSMGTLFLYSTLHLDPSHARMLAEWLDVGQYSNP